MGHARSADDSGLLFSPQPSAAPESDGMADERAADSVLFSLDRVAGDAAAASAPVAQQEGSGLVDIHSMLASQPKALEPSGNDRESSGLVDMNALMASADVPPSDSNPPLSTPFSIAPLPTSVAAPAPAAKRPAIPTGLLVGTIGALLLAVGVLAWKLTAG